MVRCGLIVFCLMKWNGKIVCRKSIMLYRVSWCCWIMCSVNWLMVVVWWWILSIGWWWCFIGLSGCLKCCCCWKCMCSVLLILLMFSVVIWYWCWKSWLVVMIICFSVYFFILWVGMVCCLMMKIIIIGSFMFIFICCCCVLWWFVSLWLVMRCWLKFSVIWLLSKLLNDCVLLVMFIFVNLECNDEFERENLNFVCWCFWLFG